MAKVLPQFTAGVVAAFGSFGIGAVIGWSAPVQKGVLEGDLGYTVTSTNFYWVSALLLLGGSVTCIPTGYIMDAIGRKLSMIAFCIPALIGWTLLLCGNHFLYAYAGRILMGIGGASFCLTAPLYCTEIAEIRIRGMLGTLYQLLIVHGVLYAYIVGAFLNTLWTSVLCAVLFVILIVMVLFIPESPVYYVSKGNTDKALKSLRWLRGKDYDASGEIKDMIAAAERMKERKASGVSVCNALCKRVPLKALAICIVLGVCQQMGGIKAVVFYITSIFQDAGTDLEAKYVSIIFGIVMCLSTFVATFVVERAGRRLLLIISGFTQGVCNAIVGFYFYQKQNGHDVSSISWLPVLAVLLYIVGYSLGFGPLPWLLLGELFSEDIKSLAGSIVCFCNWFSAFIITLVFGYFVEYIGTGPTFWIFAIINIFGAIFVLFLLPETKNRTKDEIQLALQDPCVLKKREK